MPASDKLILPFVGDPACGKSYGAEFMAENFGCTIIRPSNLLREYAAKIGMVLQKREDFLAVHRIMDDRFGPNFVTDAVLRSSANRIIVDGIRLRKQVAILKPYGLVTGFECPAEIRHERALLRGESKDNKSYEAFLTEESVEYDSDIPPYPSTHGVLAMADVMIDTALPKAAVDAQLEVLGNALFK